MFRRNKKSNVTLDVSNPEVFDMLLKIIQERDYDIPDTFVKYMTDEILVTFLLIDNHISMENAEKLITKLFPAVKHQFVVLFNLIYIYSKYEYSHAFPQMVLARVLKNRYISTHDAVQCVYDLIKHEIYIEPCLLFALLTKELGPLLMLRRWSTICDTIDNLTSVELELTEDEMEYLLPAIYDMVPKRVIRDRPDWKSRLYLYDTGRLKKFICFDTTLEEMYVYMDNYVSNEYTHELPMSLVEALYAIDNHASTKLSETDKFDIYKIKRLIQKSVILNANNANLIYWLTGKQRSLMLIDIASSKVPIDDISIFLGNTGLQAIDDSTMEKLIQGGVRISTLLPYMTDLKKFLDIIFSFDTFQKYVFDSRLSDITNIENSYKNEYLLDVLSIDYEVTINDTVLPFIDYLIQYNIIQERIVLLTVNHTLMSNRDLFINLQTDTISILMEGKDKSVYKQYPTTITSSIYNSLSQSEIHDMIVENPEVASYIPSRFVDIPTIVTSMKTNGKQFIPIYHSLLEPIRSDFIISMVTEHDTGYGYIADVNTDIQTIAIIEAILTYQSDNSYIEDN